MLVTGIFGGSFNPIHEGHTRLGEALVSEGLVDELWFVVSPQNPFKVDQQLLPDEERLRLAQLAVEGRPGLQVSDIEMRMPRPSYMVRTLEALRRDHPEREFRLVIGADNWERFPQWKESDEILRHHRLIIYPRPGYELKDLPEDVVVAQTPLLDISSTEIRRRIAEGRCHGEGLHPDVWREIQEKKLYNYKEKMKRIRVGMGFDVHRLVEGRELWLGGIRLEHAKGLLGHSDADVLIHAICDALLGAANMRDIGYHFPDTDERFRGIDSKELLRQTIDLIATKGYRVGNIDATVCAEQPKLKPHIPQMQTCLAQVMGIDEDDVSIKATTTERLGFTGREEGISAYATVLIYSE